MLSSRQFLRFSHKRETSRELDYSVLDLTPLQTVWAVAYDSESEALILPRIFVQGAKGPVCGTPRGGKTGTSTAPDQFLAFVPTFHCRF